MIVPRSNALSIRAARFADDVLDRDGNYPSNELVSFREARRAYASSAILIKTIETSQYEPARPIGCIEQVCMQFVQTGQTRFPFIRAAH